MKWMCAMVLAFGCVGHASGNVFADWLPTFEDELESIPLPDPETTLEITKYMWRGFCLADAKLFVIFTRYLAQLDAEDRAEALREQAEFRDERDVACSQTRRRYEGGSMAGWRTTETRMSVTLQRIAEIEQRMEP